MSTQTATSRIRIDVTYSEAADHSLPLPCYQTAGSAGADLLANLPADAREQGLSIAPGQRALVPTGLRMAIPEGYEVQIRPRSGLALRHGLTLVNAPGTIDADYRGDVGILLINHGTEPVQITHGMRIAQMVLARALQADLVLRDALPETARGTGGFGSTGTQAGTRP